MIYADFDLNSLKIFVSVYENGSIDLASKKLFLTQPAVSISIKKLEDKLGGKLFVRLPKGTKPTEEANMFYVHCKNAFKQIQNGIGNFSLQNAVNGNLHIGASPSIIKFLMPKIALFCKEYPNVKIFLTEVISSRLQRYLFKGEIDIALMEEPIDKIDLYDTKPICSLKPCFICSPVIKAYDLASQKIATLKTNTNLRIYLEKVCFSNNFALKIFYEMANTEAVAEFCANDLCVGFVIQEYVKDKLDSGLLKIMNQPFDLPLVTLFALTPKNSTGGLIGQKFLEYLTK